MAESYGWAGKLLRVNLTTGEITTQDDAKYHKYIGGMGMAYRIMYEEAPMDLDPYDEKAQVIFGVGPLTCLLYTSPSPRDRTRSRMPSSA